jgi:hypothetical protein
VKCMKSVVVGFSVASVVALLCSIFYLRTIQVWSGWGGGMIGFEPPLIQRSLVAVFIAAFALGFFLMARRASN